MNQHPIVPEARRAAYDRAIKRLRACILGLSAVLVALVVRAVTAGPNLPVALAATITALFLLAAVLLRRYGAGIADIIDRDD